ncbi:MAG TPA: excinuclease ABC subunit C [Bacteroidales bacterium]|nr:MAG: hypothetical protein A2W98_04295 [Bacteroidetes bacterium GWF2_33_38]OFY91527.1 MAG: hypothetical protein A2236_01160 [Bacteroidetes bacterium RIFOXYA2_FULL_33_7]HBF88440.1 excinuclease ABC subunit C [Bacteroidales bacterium]
MEIGVYILYCRNERFYVGSTNDLERRIFSHQNGYVKATKNILPIKLVAFIPCSDLKSARQFEYKIKKMKSRKYTEQLVLEYAV